MGVVGGKEDGNDQTGGCRKRLWGGEIGGRNPSLTAHEDSCRQLLIGERVHALMGGNGARRRGSEHSGIDQTSMVLIRVQSRGD